MPQTYLTTRWGDGIENPTPDQLSSALSELAVSDAEHPDCWLADDAGWTVAAHDGGKVVFENAETGEGPWHLLSATSDIVLKLWHALQTGDLAFISEHVNQIGYGN